MDLFLRKVLEQIGFNSNEIQYDVRYSNSRVEMFYTVKKNKIIFDLGKKIQFLSGDIIIVCISYRYSIEELKKILKEFFDQVFVFIDNDKSYALALCGS